MPETALYGGVSNRRITIRDLQLAKDRGERWPMLTAYDYSTAKGAVVHFTKGLALELGEFGIRANAVCPGYTITPMVLEGLGIGAQAIEAEPQKVDAAFAAVHPIPRVGRVEDIADVIVFLASDESRFVNGQAIGVDGGLSAGAHWSGHRGKMATIRTALAAERS